MPESGELSPRPWRRDLCESVQATLLWRPHTVLDYLLAVALLGILIAAFLILGARLHLVHRLL